MSDKDYSAAISAALEVAMGAPDPFQADAFRVVLEDILANSNADVPTGATGGSSPGPSPAEFIRLKKPQGGTVMLTSLAYYLDHFLNQAEFGLRNINQLASRAKIKELHPQYLVEAVKQGLITPASARGMYRITQTGEAKVEALGG
jgi:hypothetical protein